MESTPLRPREAPAEPFGCAACRNALGPEHLEDRRIPPPFVTVSERLGRPARAWTRPFRICRECDSIWLLAFSPKERTWQPHRTPLGISRALRPEATLHEVMGPLFAPAPVGSAAEEALWEIDYEPQELWDRLVDTWRRPGVERSRKAILLRQLGRLLRPANPHHRARMHQRGFLLHDLRGFDADLEGLEAELAREDGPWRAFPHAAQDLATLRSRIAAEGVLPRESDGEREPAPPPPEPPARPAGVTLAGLPPGAEWEGPEWEQDTEAESLGARTLELLRPWWNYLPAILLGWLMVELTGGRAPDGQRGMLQVFFLLFVLVATGAGATASAGISEVGLARTLLHRLSVIGEFLYLGLLAFLMVLGYVALAMPFDPGLDHPWHRFGIAVAALLPLARLWPFWMIPFMQPVERDLKRVESLGNYRRPAMATAWRMTREPGTLRTRTLPWLLAFGAALAMTALATHLGGAAGRSLVLYPLVLPTLAAFTWALIEPMPDREMD